ncbi:hypothetical protein ACOMHN_053451 [Nucella lapillus]
MIYDHLLIEGSKYVLDEEGQLKEMQRITEIVLVACLMMVMTSYLQETSAAPSWKPQGRFGKRGGTPFLAVPTNKPFYWRPQGRYGKRGGRAFPDYDSLDMAKSAPLTGDIEIPVEAVARGIFLREGVKPCTLTGVDGVAPCSGSS